MSVYNIIVFVLMLSTNFTECNQYTKVIRLCLFVSTLVGVRSHVLYRTGHLVPLEDATNSRSLMRYCDMDEPIRDHDPFMNRIAVIIAYNEELQFGSGEVITTGVFINNNHVLSSYNPFRNLRNEFGLDVMRVYYYRAKWNEFGKFHGYLIEEEDFSCARQVVPKTNHSEDQWHGPEHLHSPVHDLIVFKTVENISLSNEEKWNGTRNDSFTNLSPRLTKLAKWNDTFSNKLKFVSLGFIDDDHIMNKNHLHTVQLNREDRVLVNCAEWFIRSWGYFFCVKNVNDYIGIGSGAFLFSQEKVFGVGSFTLQKGNDSILVFTDIRPYRQEIFRTCTVKDGGQHGFSFIDEEVSTTTESTSDVEDAT